MVLFDGDRAAVFLRQDDGGVVAGVSRGLSTAYLAGSGTIRPRSLAAAAVAARRPLYAVDYRNDPRAEDVRAAVVQEGFDTICSAPLLDGTQMLGLLNIYHDHPHHWTDGRARHGRRARDPGQRAIRAAQDYERMASWAAQLQSIQQLGHGSAGCPASPRSASRSPPSCCQLIDYHNAARLPAPRAAT
jgi:GAF domain-containing protein